MGRSGENMKNRPYIKRNCLLKTSLLLVVFFATLPSIAHAYKIKTHAFIGQQVVESIENCTKRNTEPCFTLHIAGGNSIDVEIDAEIATAILNNRETYVIGNYGPDAFPDIVAGQTVIHPGAPNGLFGTGDWLELALSEANTPKEISFAYGFLGHAASDTFAHTYVNQYAGGIFSLLDGELEVEERHNLLESLIAKYTPEIRGSSYDAIFGDGEHDIPLEYIYRVFFQSDHARKMYVSGRGGFSTHIVVFENIVRAFDRALVKVELDLDISFDRLGRLFSGENEVKGWREFVKGGDPRLEGAGLVQLIEVYVTQHIVQSYFGIQLEIAEAQLLSDISSKMHDALNDKTAGALGKIQDAELELNKLLANSSTKTLNKFQEFSDDLDGIKKKFDALNIVEKDLGRVANEIGNLTPSMILNSHKLCRKGCAALPAQITKQVACQVRRDTERFCERRLPIKVPGTCGPWWARYPCLTDQLGPLERYVCGTTSVLVDGLCNSTIANPELKICEAGCQGTRDANATSLKAAMNVRESLFRKRAAAERSIALARNEAFNLTKEASKTVNDLVAKKVAFERNIKNQVHRWNQSFRKLFESQRSDIRLAISDYSKANAHAMTNTMNTKWWASGTIRDGNSSVLEPLKKWLICSAPVIFGGVPKITGDGACDVINAHEALQEKIGELENGILKELSIDGKSPLDIKEWVAEQGPHFFMKQNQSVLDELSERLGLGVKFDFRRHHNGFTFDGNDAKVDEFFSKNPLSTGKKLIEFVGEGTISARVKHDMQLERKSKFGAKDFPPVANSIQLAKLSLLKADQLNKLAFKLGYRGSNLYLGTQNNNILTHWLRSIDGNHQWLTLSPQYPRKMIGDDKLWFSSRDYLKGVENVQAKKRLARIFGYLPTMRARAGMPFYSNSEARETVFSKIFVGPLSPGLYNLNGEYPDVIPRRYHYRPTYKNPFPDISGSP